MSIYWQIISNQSPGILFSAVEIEAQIREIEYLKGEIQGGQTNENIYG